MTDRDVLIQVRDMLGRSPRVDAQSISAVLRFINDHLEIKDWVYPKGPVRGPRGNPVDDVRDVVLPDEDDDGC